MLGSKVQFKCKQLGAPISWLVIFFRHCAYLKMTSGLKGQIN